MRLVDTKNYGPAAQELLALAAQLELPRTLNVSAPVAAALPALKVMTDQTLSANRRVRMPHDAQALHAGLWSLFDYFEQSHELSQVIATPSGSYWHAILHRREPDASNAKYWFARIGEHPVQTELLEDARELASGASLAGTLNAATAWDAPWFVDQCTTATDPAIVKTLLAIERREWQLLFDYNFRKAFA
jgi:hypothetical protein